MKNRKYLGMLASGLGLSAALLAPGAIADSFDGNSNVICSTVNVTACTSEGLCLQGQAQTFDMPAFMIIDVKKKLVRATGDSDGDASSPIKAKAITEQSVILQGFENHRGWTMAIDRSDGSLNLSSTGPDVNFMITGNCTAI
jgi:hypothetical protein